MLQTVCLCVSVCARGHTLYGHERKRKRVCSRSTQRSRFSLRRYRQQAHNSQSSAPPVASEYKNDECVLINETGAAIDRRCVERALRPTGAVFFYLLLLLLLLLLWLLNTTTWLLWMCVCLCVSGCGCVRACWLASLTFGVARHALAAAGSSSQHEARAALRLVMASEALLILR